MAHETAPANAGPSVAARAGRSLRPLAEQALMATLDETLEALRSNRIPFLLIGALASSVLGRKRWTRDIDVFVHPGMADYTLRSLASVGFETRMVDATWLAKADRGGVGVDIIFRSSGGIELDDEMLRRASVYSFRGRRVPLPAPEDLLVMKTLASREDTARYWHDAVAIAALPLDWEYLVRRARLTQPQRVASLLLFARSEGVDVPEGIIEALLEHAHA
jgi:Nucleotidyl transferase of unknown function (DUF2204)